MNCLDFSGCYQPGLSGRSTGNLSPISCIICFVLGTSQLQREREHLKSVLGCKASQVIGTEQASGLLLPPSCLTLHFDERWVLYVGITLC